MPPPHRKRCKRYNDLGHAHFFTFSCWKRLPLLSRDRSRQWFIQSLNRSLLKHDIACWAYVIMPEHAHVLLLPRREHYDISAWLRSFKLGVARPALRYLAEHQPAFLKTLEDRQPSGRVSYRFWQPGGGVDVNLWTDTKIWDKIDYHHNNPVRRRLVEKPEDWEWSSCRDYLAARQVGPVPIDFESLPRDPRRQ
jgi:putative transposase